MDNTNKTSIDRIEVYKDAIGEYRWSAHAHNNQITATSGEGYINKNHAMKMAIEFSAGAPVVYVEN